MSLFSRKPETSPGGATTEFLLALDTRVRKLEAGSLSLRVGELDSTIWCSDSRPEVSLRTVVEMLLEHLELKLVHVPSNTKLEKK